MKANIYLFFVIVAFSFGSIQSDALADRASGTHTLQLKIAQKEKRKVKKNRRVKKKRSPTAKKSIKKRTLKKSSSSKQRLANRKRIKKPSKTMPYTTMIPISIVTIFLGTLIFHRRSEALGSVPLRKVSEADRLNINFQARPVKLKKHDGPDPAANDARGTQLCLGDTSLEDINLDNDTNADCAVDLDRAVSLHGNMVELALDDEQVDPLQTSGSKETSNLQLPAEMSLHFRGIPQEEKIWQTEWNIPLVSKGAVVITNYRMMSTYWRVTFSWLPPFKQSQFRRHQTRISNIKSVESVQVRRPSFLVAGILLALWFPIGTLSSAFCFMGYLLINRTELAANLRNDQMRTYPIEANTVNQALQAFEEAKTLQYSAKVKPPAKLDKDEKDEKHKNHAV